MPALSFKREWINTLLSGGKTQTTRKPTTPGKPPRIKPGDLCQIYIEQRRKISDKPIYPTTDLGRTHIYQKILDGKYPNPVQSTIHYDDLGNYYAHFLGTVYVTNIYTLNPSNLGYEELNEWAWRDGFCNFDIGDQWFCKHHNNANWKQQRWDVIQWDTWEEKYYNIPNPIHQATTPKETT